MDVHSPHISWWFSYILVGHQSLAVLHAHWRTVSRNSSLSLNLWPFSAFFIASNSVQPLEARSGEYGGCGNKSQGLPTQQTVSRLVCGCALSCRSNTQLGPLSRAAVGFCSINFAMATVTCTADCHPLWSQSTKSTSQSSQKHCSLLLLSLRSCMKFLGSVLLSMCARRPAEKWHASAPYCCTCLVAWPCFDGLYTCS